MTLKEQISWCKSQIKGGNNVEVLRSILKRLQSIENKNNAPPGTYQTCVDIYAAFLARRGIPLVMDGRQGKQLKEIIAKLSTVSIDKSDDGVLRSWSFILNNWERTGDFIGRQIKLSDINRNLQEILDKIKNGATKKQSRLDEAEQLANAIAAKYSSSS